MATIVTPLMDGGRVEVEWAAGGDLKVQKFDAGGAAVGARDVASPLYMSQPEVAPLAGGGFVIVTSFASRGGAIYTGFVYDAGGARVATLDLPGGGHGYDIAASPDGGFLVVSMEKAPVPPNGSPPDTTFQPLLTLYDNAGQVVRGPVGLSGDLPAVTVQADGDYLVQWNDGGIVRTLEIDPSDPPALAKPPAPTLTILDDQGPDTGPITDYSTDATPVARVAVSETGTVLVTRSDGGGAYEPTLDGGVQVTAADVARGYIDVPVSGSAADGLPTTWYARFKNADGVVSDAATDRFTFVLRPEIWSVTDDAGAQTGLLADGATTDDATPTVRIGLESSGLAEGQTLYVRDGSTIVGETVLTAQDVARGYATITTSPLSAGDHSLQAHNGGPLPAFRLTVATTASPSGDGGPTAGHVLTSDQYGDTLQGGAGSDTLIAGQGPDQLTGGGGADVFAYRDTPWNAGHVTDFAVGTDRLDLSALFQASGYSGADPQADGYIRLQADGTGAAVYFDTDGPASGNTIWFKITTLQGVGGDTAWAQLGGEADPPPPPPSEDGEVIISQRYGDTLTGGEGADTLLAGRGPDQLTGGGGEDVFILRETPWSAGVVTDFAVGADRLDLSELLADSGYSGSDPVADGWVRFEQASGGARVLVDTDGPAAGNTIWFQMTTLEGVSASGLTWASLSGDGSGDPPPPLPDSGGEVLTSDQYGDTLQGGAGSDTLNAGQGPDQLTGGGGADRFVFADFPWNGGRITDFTPGTDKLDLSGLLSTYAGSDPVADHRLEFRADGQGSTQVYVDRDDPDAGEWPFLVTTLQGVAPGQLGPGDWIA